MLAMKTLLVLTLALLAGAPDDSGEAAVRKFEVDTCLGGKCKNGRVESVTVTPEQFIVQINPNRCARTPTHRCPTSYGRFTVDGETPPRVQGYTLGEKSAERFTVYVPREYKTLHVAGINGSERFAAFELAPYEIAFLEPAQRSGAEGIDGPALLLTSPALENDYFVTTESAVQIAGAVAGVEGVAPSVAVNGVVVPVTDDGRFRTEVALIPGRNSFAVSADTGSFRVRRVIVVERRPGP